MQTTQTSLGLFLFSASFIFDSWADRVEQRAERLRKMSSRLKMFGEQFIVRAQAKAEPEIQVETH